MNPQNIMIYFGEEGRDGFMAHKCSCCDGTGQKRCPRCWGTGTFDDGSTCYYCQGTGTVTCNACDGRGQVED